MLQYRPKRIYTNCTEKNQESVIITKLSSSIMLNFRLLKHGHEIEELGSFEIKTN